MKVREMAGNPRFEISSSSLDGSNFTGYCNGQRSHFSSASSMERSSSFRETIESRLLTAGTNLSRGSISAHGEHSPLSQVLMLDMLSVGDLKYPRHADLKRVTNAALGTMPEDPSLGAVQAKSLASLGAEELKRVKSSVTEISQKARERAKCLNEAICKLEKYRTPMLSRKRSRTELATSTMVFPVDRSAVAGNLIKAAQPNYTNSNSADPGSQRPDDRKPSVPNKRVRTSMMDIRVEGRPNNLPRPSLMADRERDMLRTGNAVSQLEDKDRTLPAASDGWEKAKMKGRRSGMKSDVAVNTVANRTMDGERDLKRAIQQRPNTESRARPSEGHGFRPGPVHGIVSLHKMENSSQTGGLNARAVARNEPDSTISVNEKKDRLGGSEKDRSIIKGNIKPSIREVNTTTNSKAKGSRGPRSNSGVTANSSPNLPRTSTFDSLERPQAANNLQIFAASNIRKRSLSSSPPVTQWGVQRAPKMQRVARRTNMVPPVSNRDDMTNLADGLSNPDSGTKPDSTEANGQGFLRRYSINGGIQESRSKTENVSSLAGLSESEESGAGDNKSRDKNKKQGDADEKVLPVSQKVGSLVLPSKKIKTVTREESGDAVRRQGRSGRGFTPLKANVPPPIVKLENAATTKQLRSTRPGSDKVESKTGRPPTKKTSFDRKPITRPRRPMNSESPDLTGESDDDREELLAAVKAAVNASDVACSGPFWKQMEPFFAFITQDDLDFLKQQVREVEDAHASTFGTESDQNRKANVVCSTMPEAVIPIISTKQRTSPNGCLDNEALAPLSSLNARDDIERSSGNFRLLENMLPLSQRLLSALIVEEDVEEAKKALYYGPKNNCVKYTQEESLCGNCNQIESETQNAERMDTERESEVELQNCKNHMTDSSQYGIHNANGHRNYLTGNNCSDDFGEEGNAVNSEKVNFHREFGVLDERHMQSGGKSQDDQQIEYKEMCLDQRIFLELQSIGLFPESVPDLSQREDDEIKADISKLKNELQQQVSKTRVQLQNLEQAVLKRREVEERERETLAMNKLVEIAYNRHMGCKGNNASGGKSGGNKTAKQATLAFAKRTLAKYQKFLETRKSCFTEPYLKERLISMSSKEKDRKVATDVIEDNPTNVLAENAHALSDIKTSAVFPISSQHAPLIASHSTQKLENEDRELCNTMQEMSPHLEPSCMNEELCSTQVKTKELPLQEVSGSDILRGAPALGSTSLGGTKGKRSERDREGKGQNKEILTRSGTAKNGRPGLGNAKGERKTKPKPRQKTAQLSAAANGLLGKPAEVSKASDKVRVKDELQTPVNVSSGNGPHDNEGAIDLSHLPLPGMEEFVGPDDLGGQDPPDLGSWLTFEDDALQDAAGDFMGLDVPMDDLTELTMMV